MPEDSGVGGNLICDIPLRRERCSRRRARARRRHWAELAGVAMRPTFRNAGERNHPGLAVAENTPAMRPAFWDAGVHDSERLAGAGDRSAMRPGVQDAGGRRPTPALFSPYRCRNEADVRDAGGRGVVGLIHPIKGQLQ